MDAPIQAAIDAALKPVESPTPSADGLPHVTHAGTFDLFPGLRMQCYRLSDGRAVIDEASMHAFWRWMRGEKAES